AVGCSDVGLAEFLVAQRGRRGWAGLFSRYSHRLPTVQESAAAMDAFAWFSRDGATPLFALGAGTAALVVSVPWTALPPTGMHHPPPSSRTISGCKNWAASSVSKAKRRAARKRGLKMTDPPLVMFGEPLIVFQRPFDAWIATRRFRKVWAVI